MTGMSMVYFSFGSSIAVYMVLTAQFFCDKGRQVLDSLPADELTDFKGNFVEYKYPGRRAHDQ